MLRYIEKLQHEPEEKRRRVALAAAFFITLIVVLVWLSTFSARFSPLADETSEAISPESPFSLIQKKMSALVDSVNETIDSFGSEEYVKEE